MILDPSTIQAGAGAVSSLTGVITQIQGVATQMRAAKQLMKTATDEAQAIVNEGDQLAVNARQRANAALQDIGYLQAVTDANTRALAAEQHRAESLAQAHAAGSGITFTGSPLLVQLDTALQFERAKANQELTQRIGTRRFQFELEKELATAASTPGQYAASAQARLNLRTNQAGVIQQTSLTGLVKTSDTTGKLLENKGFQALVKSIYPSGSSPAPYAGPTGAGF